MLENHLVQPPDPRTTILELEHRIESLTEKRVFLERALEAIYDLGCEAHNHGLCDGAFNVICADLENARDDVDVKIEDAKAQFEAHPKVLKSDYLQLAIDMARGKE